MEPVELNRTILLRIWWAYTWRALLGAIVLGVGVALLGGSAIIMLGADRGYLPAVSLLSTIVSTIWSIYAFRRVLSKDFGDFRISLTRR